MCRSRGAVPEGQQKAAQPPPVPLGPRTFWMEAAFLTIIIIYGITYWIGRTANNKLATAWYSEQSHACIWLTKLCEGRWRTTTSCAPTSRKA